MSAITVPNPSAREYADALARDPARRHALDRLRRLMPAPDGRLTRLYEAGRLVVRLRPERTYRTRWADTLAERVGIDRSFMFKLALFADSYTADQVDELQESGVTWSHLSAALKLHDTDQAVDLLLAAAGRGWTVRQVQDFLRGVPADHPGPLDLAAAPAADLDALVRSATRRTRPLLDHIFPALQTALVTVSTPQGEVGRDRVAELASGLRAVAVAAKRLVEQAGVLLRSPSGH